MKCIKHVTRSWNDERISSLVANGGKDAQRDEEEFIND